MSLLRAHDAIRVFGFHKFATEYLRDLGEDPPESWDLASTLGFIGGKIVEAAEREAHVLAGLEDAKALCGDAKMAAAESFTPDFHAVKSLMTSMDKTASAGFRERVASEQLGLWNRMKSAAERTPSPVGGLAELALQVWSETERTGDKTACTRDERAAFASSFAANYLVDQKVAAMAAAGELRPEEAAKLANLSAEAAMEDLVALTHGVPREKDASFYTDPRVIGAAIGAGGGAAIGAWDDSDNRLRGAAMGGLLGMPLGMVGGQVAKELMDNRTLEQAQALAAAAEKTQLLEQARQGFERLRRGAQHMPTEVQQALDANRSRIVDHFHAGNKNLPNELLGLGNGQLDPGAVEMLGKVMKDYNSPLIG